MRIGLDATFLRPDARHSGMGVYVRELAAGLEHERGAHEVVLLGYGPRPEDAPAALPWRALTPLPAGRAGPWLSHQLVLPAAARRLRLDLVHVTGVNLRLSMPGVPLWLPCPLLVTVHDAIPLGYYGRLAPPLPWRLRAAYRVALVAIRRAAGILTVSQTSRHDIVAALDVAPERVHVVYNGLNFPAAIDEARRRTILDRLGIKEPYLFYAGSYEPRKNLLGAVQAYGLALTRRDLPPMVMLVERESGHKAAVLEQVRRCGLVERLRFVHSLSSEDLATVYHGAEMLLFPSLYEGFGFPPLQALACGVPVVAARAGSLPEVLGDAAHFVDPASPASIAEGIVRLLEDSSYARLLSERGPARAARFRWDVAARETRGVYELIGGAMPGVHVAGGPA